MTKKKNHFFAIVLIALSFAVTDANAQFKAEAMAGYGFEDGYNLGFGARVGKDGLTESLKQIYVGGVFAYHLGKTVESFGVKSTVNLWYAGGDVGYNISLEGQSFTLRPSAYVGIASINAKIEFTGGGFGFGGSSGSATEVEAMLAPGASVFFPIGDLTVGADARFFLVSNSNAFVANLTIGKSF